MFWNRKAPESPAAPPREARLSDDFDAALDTITIFLRTYGEHAFDTEEGSAEEVRLLCEKLATELLVGRRMPDAEGNLKLRRDWGEARRWIAAHRPAEQRHVQESFGNMRQAVQAFATCLSRSISEDRSDDEKVGAQLGQLVGAFQSNDTATIRSESEQLAAMVQASIENRRQRERSQLEELGERVRALRAELREARQQATTDPLTQVFNRAAFDSELARLCALGLMLGTEPCLLMIDIDHFKKVNDSYGHPMGDEVLRKVGSVLVKTFLRKEDFVARYGGEEFAVVLPDADVEGVYKRAEKVRQALREVRFEHRGDPFWVTASIGLAALRPGEEPEQWLARADEALYAAKKLGRDRVVVDGWEPPRKGRTGTGTTPRDGSSAAAGSRTSAPAAASMPVARTRTGSLPAQVVSRRPAR